MEKITSYTTKKGEKKYQFQVYKGVDQQTGKKKTTRRRGFKTKKSAELALARFKTELDKNGMIEKENNITFEEVYKEWYQEYVNTVRESTYARTTGMFDNHILPAFGDMRIRTMKTEQIQRVVNKWFKMTNVNYRKWYDYTAQVLEFAIKRGYVNKWTMNPARRITMPKKSDDFGDKPANFWDKDELIKFFDCLDSVEDIEKFTLFRVLAFAGLRRGELLALTWEDVNFTQGTLRINKTLTQGMKGKQILQAPKTRAGRRTILLDSVTMTQLKKWRTAQKQLYLTYGINTMNKKQLVFATYKNTFKVLNCPAKWLHAIIKAHNLKPITIHGFRHTCASAMFASGATIKEVQERLGHEDVKTTLNIYAHVSKKESKQAVDKLTSYLGF